MHVYVSVCDDLLRSSLVIAGVVERNHDMYVCVCVYAQYVEVCLKQSLLSLSHIHTYMYVLTCYVITCYQLLCYHLLSAVVDSKIEPI